MAELAQPPDHFACPLTFELMVDPVVDPTSGTTYEKAAIVEWLTKNATSPVSGAALRPSQLVPNLALRNAIDEWREAHGVPAPPRVVEATAAAEAVEVVDVDAIEGLPEAEATPIDLTAPDAIDLTSPPRPARAAAAGSGGGGGSGGRWEFRGDDGAWQPFDADASEAVEQAFGSNPRGAVGYRARGNEYHVDFSDMTQTNTASSVERRIRRVDPSAAASAPVWEFEDGPSGSGAWRRFDADGAAQAESARGGQFCFGRGSGTYFVDTGAMTQTNVETSVSRRIRRRLA